MPAVGHVADGQENLGDLDLRPASLSATTPDRLRPEQIAAARKEFAGRSDAWHGERLAGGAANGGIAGR